MYVHILRMNPSVKRVVLCLQMQNNLKNYNGIDFRKIGLKMTELCVFIIKYGFGHGDFGGPDFKLTMSNQFQVVKV
jgi:hypothetical protein